MSWMYSTCTWSCRVTCLASPKARVWTFDLSFWLTSPNSVSPPLAQVYLAEAQSVGVRL